jgi:hypothetical protein
MKQMKCWVLAGLLAAAICVAAPSAASAQALAPASATEATTDAPPLLEPETRLGALAAIGCGFGIRISIMTGGNIGAIVGTVALCLYALVDALGTPG